MKGIKKHTHAEREKVLHELVPQLKQKFGKNLIAIAARGSFARKTDGPYSDLELFAFLKEMPRGQKKIPYGKMRKIRDGLLVEIIWVTKEVYIREVKDVSSAWFGSGADILYPVYNPTFADRLNVYKVKDIKMKCLNQAVANWDRVQEATTKVLNAAEQKNHLGMALVLHDMFSNMLKVLSFINQTPYSTFSQLIQESKQLKYRPKFFESLTRIIVDGDYKNYSKITTTVIEVFTELETYLEGQGFTIYEENYDINR
jgi:kanamycin nucleotidyltransferase